MSSLPKGLLNQKIRGKVFAQLIGVLHSSGGEMDFMGFLLRVGCTSLGEVSSALLRPVSFPGLL
jgi:hypothetical protein